MYYYKPVLPTYVI